MKVLGYVRVSSIEQSFGTSLDDQARAIRDCAKARKLPAPKIFREVISGKNKSRPQFDALMQSAEKGDWVFCVHVDRWGRDLVKIVTSTDELSAKGVRVHFINNAIDAWTDGGKLQLRYIAVGAEAEHASIRRRMVGTRQLLRNQGFFIEGHVTFGYKRPHAPGYKGPNKNVLDVHETNGPKVREIFRLSILGDSLDTIGSKVDVHRDTVGDVLRNRFYTGKIKNTDGQWIDGKHPALIDAATFVAARKSVDARMRKGRKANERGHAETQTWILRDLARCAHCGGKMGAAYAGERDANGIHARHYYRCLAKCQNKRPHSRATAGTHVAVKPIEDQARSIVLTYLETLQTKLTEPAKTIARPIVDVKAKRAKLEAKRSRFVVAFADGVITKSQLAAHVAKVDAELLALDAERPPADPLEDREGRRAALADIEALATSWLALASPAEQRRIINLLAERVNLTARKPPSFVWRIDDLAARLQEASDVLVKQTDDAAGFRRMLDDARPKKIAKKRTRK